VMAVAVLALRRGILGRLLVALRDSPSACGTLGLDQRWFRVALFGLSAGLAGLAGALFAGLRGTIGAADFQYFASLPLLLLAVVFGVTSVTGACLGGVGLMLLPELQANHPDLAGLLFVVLGFGAVALGRDPNGLANHLFKLGRLARGYAEPWVRSRIPVWAPRLDAAENDVPLDTRLSLLDDDARPEDAPTAVGAPVSGRDGEEPTHAPA